MQLQPAKPAESNPFYRFSAFLYKEQTRAGVVTALFKDLPTIRKFVAKLEELELLRYFCLWVSREPDTAILAGVLQLKDWPKSRPFLPYVDSIKNFVEWYNKAEFDSLAVQRNWLLFLPKIMYILSKM